MEAHVALNALVANLVRVQAGADVYIKSVDLTLQGVRAEALVLVDLDNVYYIADRALQLIDNNPQIFSQLYRTAGRAVGTVGELANTALQPGGLLSQTVNTLAQTVMRTLDTTGRIVERTIDTAGKVVGRERGGFRCQPAAGARNGRHGGRNGTTGSRHHRRIDRIYGQRRGPDHERASRTGSNQPVAETRGTRYRSDSQ